MENSSVIQSKHVFLLNKLKSSINVICPYGLGDTMLLCGYRKALEKKYGEKIHFIIKPYHQIVMKIYGITDYTVQKFTKEELNDIAKEITRPKKGEFFIAHPAFLNGRKDLYDPVLDNELSFVEVFKKILNIDSDADIDIPVKYPELSATLKEKIEKIAASPIEKIVLVVPEAQSLDVVNTFFYEKEIQKCLKKGLTPVCCVQNLSNSIDGVINLDLTLEEMLILALNCKKTVAMRSGFCDIISPAVKDLTVYYPNLEAYEKYNLAAIIGYNKNIKEIVVEGSFVDKITPFFQVEHKSDEKLCRFCITLFRIKKKRGIKKCCIFGIPIFKAKDKTLGDNV